MHSEESEKEAPHTWKRTLLSVAVAIQAPALAATVDWGEMWSTTHIAVGLVGIALLLVAVGIQRRWDHHAV